jgi:hypothetical protein
MAAQRCFREEQYRGATPVPNLPDRSIIRKLLTVLEIASSTGAGTSRELADQISAERRVEFSFFRPGGDRRHRLGYSTAISIAAKVRFAMALRLLSEDCVPTISKRDFSSDQKAAVLFSERAKELLSGADAPLSLALKNSIALLGKDPPQLPTAQKLYAECKTDKISFKWFRLCLSILLYEPDGALGVSARRIYMPRSGEHQQPGEIGE